MNLVSDNSTSVWQDFCELSDEILGAFDEQGQVCQRSGAWKNVLPEVSMWDLLHPEDLELFKQGLLSLHGREVKVLEVRCRHLDGHFTHIRFKIKKALSGDLFLASGVDISEIKILRESLKQIDEIYEIGTWEVDLDTGSLYWSLGTYKIHEVDPLTFKPVLKDGMSFYHPESMPLITALVKEMMEDGKSYDVILRLITAKGNHRWVRAISRVEMRGKTVIRCYGTIQDITERVRMEAEHKFIMDALDVGIWKFNPVTRELIWDQSMYRLFEINEKDFSGDFEAWQSALTEESQGNAVSSFFEALEEGSDFDSTFSIYNRQRGKKHIGAKGKIVRDENGKPVMVYGMNWDKTRQVELERQLERERSLSEMKLHQSAKMASLGEMAGGVAHEINNPLTIIHARANQILRNIEAKALDIETLSGDLNKIKNTADRIARIVRGLRSFSRDSSGDPSRVASLSGIIEDTVELCRERFKNHEITLNIEGDLQKKIFCRPEQISQVILNLLNNAHDAVIPLESKWIQLRVDQVHDYLQISITDSGSGVSAEHLDKIMLPFFTTKEVGKGTGLGLSISRSIIADHQGELYYDSKSPHTCFVIKLPLFKTVE